MSIPSTECARWREAIRAWVSEDLAGEKGASVQRHVVGCEGCRHYAKELRAAAAGLRRLADQPVAPSPGFRARWMRAVDEAAHPKGLGEAMETLATWWRRLLQPNLRPALGIACLWALALFFRLSTPDVSPATQTVAARSPVEILRALKAGEQLLAEAPGQTLPPLVVPHKPRPSDPRSEGLPTVPTAQGDREPGLHIRWIALHRSARLHEGSTMILEV
jgi:hypothetical protein